MATWKEQRAYLEQEADATVDDLRAAIRAALARLDAAERVIDAQPGSCEEQDARVAYDALVREQDGGES